MFAVAGAVFVAAAALRAGLLTSCRQRCACCDRDRDEPATGKAMALAEADAAVVPSSAAASGASADPAAVVLTPRGAASAEVQLAAAEWAAVSEKQQQQQAPPEAGQAPAVAESAPLQPAAAAPAASDSDAAPLKPAAPAPPAVSFGGKFKARAAHALLILGCIVFLKATTLLLQVRLRWLDDACRVVPVLTLHVKADGALRSGVQACVRAVSDRAGQRRSHHGAQTRR
jgi:hypothetical protein